MENLMSQMEEKSREQKRARTVRTEYNRGKDVLESWLQQAELKVQDKTSQPQIIKENLQHIQAELPAMQDKLEQVTKNAKIICENCNDPEEVSLITERVNTLTEQLTMIRAWIDTKKQQVGDSLDSWERFITLYNTVLNWVQEKKEFLKLSLDLPNLEQAKAKLHDYNGAVKHCKNMGKILSEMSKELNHISENGSIGDLSEKMEEAETAKAEVESQLLERNALLHETSEEWEQCEKKLREVRAWINKTKGVIDQGAGKKKPLRDQLATKEKVMADITIQKTKISVSIEKLQVHFKSGLTGGEGVVETGETMKKELDGLHGVVRQQSVELEEAINQVEQYQQELLQLKQEVVTSEQKLRTISSPNYLPHDKDTVVKEQMDLRNNIHQKRDKICELIKMVRVHNPVWPYLVEMVLFSESETQTAILELSEDKLSYADVTAGRISPCPQLGSRTASPVHIDRTSINIYKPERILFDRNLFEQDIIKFDKGTKEDVTPPVVTNISSKMEYSDDDNDKEETRFVPVQDELCEIKIYSDNKLEPVNQDSNKPTDIEINFEQDITPTIRRLSRYEEFKRTCENPPTIQFELIEDSSTSNKDNTSYNSGLQPSLRSRSRSKSPIWIPGESASYSDVLKGMSRNNSRAPSPEGVSLVQHEMKTNTQRTNNSAGVTTITTTTVVSKTYRGTTRSEEPIVTEYVAYEDKPIKYNLQKITSETLGSDKKKRNNPLKVDEVKTERSNEQQSSDKNVSVIESHYVKKQIKESSPQNLGKQRKPIKDQHPTKKGKIVDQQDKLVFKTKDVTIAERNKKDITLTDTATFLLSEIAADKANVEDVSDNGGKKRKNKKKRLKSNISLDEDNVEKRSLITPCADEINNQHLQDNTEISPMIVAEIITDTVSDNLIPSSIPSNVKVEKPSSEESNKTIEQSVQEKTSADSSVKTSGKNKDKKKNKKRSSNSEKSAIKLSGSDSDLGNKININNEPVEIIEEITCTKSQPVSETQIKETRLPTTSENKSDIKSLNVENERENKSKLLKEDKHKKEVFDEKTKRINGRQSKSKKFIEQEVTEKEPLPLGKSKESVQYESKNKKKAIRKRPKEKSAEVIESEELVSKIAVQLEEIQPTDSESQVDSTPSTEVTEKDEVQKSQQVEDISFSTDKEEVPSGISIKETPCICLTSDQLQEDVAQTICTTIQPTTTSASAVKSVESIVISSKGKGKKKKKKDKSSEEVTLTKSEQPSEDVMMVVASGELIDQCEKQDSSKLSANESPDTPIDLTRAFLLGEQIHYSCLNQDSKDSLIDTKQVDSYNVKEFSEIPCSTVTTQISSGVVDPYIEGECLSSTDSSNKTEISSFAPVEVEPTDNITDLITHQVNTSELSTTEKPPWVNEIMEITLKNLDETTSVLTMYKKTECLDRKVVAETENVDQEIREFIEEDNLVDNNQPSIKFPDVSFSSEKSVLDKEGESILPSDYKTNVNTSKTDFQQSTTTFTNEELPIRMETQGFYTKRNITSVKKTTTKKVFITTSSTTSFSSSTGSTRTERMIYGQPLDTDDSGSGVTITEVETISTPPTHDSQIVQEIETHETDLQEAAGDSEDFKRQEPIVQEAIESSSLIQGIPVSVTEETFGSLNFEEIPNVENPIESESFIQITEKPVVEEIVEIENLPKEVPSFDNPTLPIKQSDYKMSSETSITSSKKSQKKKKPHLANKQRSKDNEDVSTEFSGPKTTFSETLQDVIIGNLKKSQTEINKPAAAIFSIKERTFTMANEQDKSVKVEESNTNITEKCIMKTFLDEERGGTSFDITSQEDITEDNYEKIPHRAVADLHEIFATSTSPLYEISVTSQYIKDSKLEKEVLNATETNVSDALLTAVEETKQVVEVDGKDSCESVTPGVVEISDVTEAVTPQEDQKKKNKRKKNKKRSTKEITEVITKSKEETSETSQLPPHNLISSEKLTSEFVGSGKDEESLTTYVETDIIKTDIIEEKPLANLQQNKTNSDQLEKLDAVTDLKQIEKEEVIDVGDRTDTIETSKNYQGNRLKMSVSELEDIQSQDKGEKPLTTSDESVRENDDSSKVGTKASSIPPKHSKKKRSKAKSKGDSENVTYPVILSSSSVELEEQNLPKESSEVNTPLITAATEPITVEPSESHPTKPDNEIMLSTNKFIFEEINSEQFSSPPGDSLSSQVLPKLEETKREEITQSTSESTSKEPPQKLLSSKEKKLREKKKKNSKPIPVTNESAAATPVMTKERVNKGKQKHSSEGRKKEKDPKISEKEAAESLNIEVSPAEEPIERIKKESSMFVFEIPEKSAIKQDIKGKKVNLTEEKQRIEDVESKVKDDPVSAFDTNIIKVDSINVEDTLINTAPLIVPELSINKGEVSVLMEEKDEIITDTSKEENSNLSQEEKFQLSWETDYKNLTSIKPETETQEVLTESDSLRLKSQKVDVETEVKGGTQPDTKFENVQLFIDNESIVPCEIVTDVTSESNEKTEFTETIQTLSRSSTDNQIEELTSLTSDNFEIISEPEIEPKITKLESIDSPESETCSTSQFSFGTSADTSWLITEDDNVESPIPADTKRKTKKKKSKSSIEKSKDSQVHLSKSEKSAVIIEPSTLEKEEKISLPGVENVKFQISEQPVEDKTSLPERTTLITKTSVTTVVSKKSKQISETEIKPVSSPAEQEKSQPVVDAESKSDATARKKGIHGNKNKNRKKKANVEIPSEADSVVKEEKSELPENINSGTPTTEEVIELLSTTERKPDAPVKPEEADSITEDKSPATAPNKEDEIEMETKSGTPKPTGSSGNVKRKNKNRKAEIAVKPKKLESPPEIKTENIPAKEIKSELISESENRLEALSDERGPVSREDVKTIDVVEGLFKREEIGKKELEKNVDKQSSSSISEDSLNEGKKKTKKKKGKSGLKTTPADEDQVERYLEENLTSSTALKQPEKSISFTELVEKQFPSSFYDVKIEDKKYLPQESNSQNITDSLTHETSNPVSNDPKDSITMGTVPVKAEDIISKLESLKLVQVEDRNLENPETDVELERNILSKDKITTTASTIQPTSMPTYQRSLAVTYAEVTKRSREPSLVREFQEQPYKIDEVTKDSSPVVTEKFDEIVLSSNDDQSSGKLLKPSDEVEQSKTKRKSRKAKRQEMKSKTGEEIVDRSRSSGTMQVVDASPQSLSPFIGETYAQVVRRSREPSPISFGNNGNTVRSDLFVMGMKDQVVDDRRPLLVSTSSSNNYFVQSPNENFPNTTQTSTSSDFIWAEQRVEKATTDMEVPPHPLPRTSEKDRQETISKDQSETEEKITEEIIETEDVNLSEPIQIEVEIQKEVVEIPEETQEITVVGELQIGIGELAQGAGDEINVPLELTSEDSLVEKSLEDMPENIEKDNLSRELKSTISEIIEKESDYIEDVTGSADETIKDSMDSILPRDDETVGDVVQVEVGISELTDQTPQSDEIEINAEIAYSDTVSNTVSKIDEVPFTSSAFTEPEEKSPKQLVQHFIEEEINNVQKTFIPVKSVEEQLSPAVPCDVSPGETQEVIDFTEKVDDKNKNEDEQKTLPFEGKQVELGEVITKGKKKKLKKERKIEVLSPKKKEPQVVEVSKTVTLVPSPDIQTEIVVTETAPVVFAPEDGKEVLENVITTAVKRTTVKKSVKKQVIYVDGKEQSSKEFVEEPYSVVFPEENIEVSSKKENISLEPAESERQEKNDFPIEEIITSGNSIISIQTPTGELVCEEPILTTEVVPSDVTTVQKELLSATDNTIVTSTQQTVIQRRTVVKRIIRKVVVIDGVEHVHEESFDEPQMLDAVTSPGISFDLSSLANEKDTVDENVSVKTTTTVESTQEIIPIVEMVQHKEITTSSRDESGDVIDATKDQPVIMQEIKQPIETTYTTIKESYEIPAPQQEVEIKITECRKTLSPIEKQEDKDATPIRKPIEETVVIKSVVEDVLLQEETTNVDQDSKEAENIIDETHPKLEEIHPTMVSQEVEEIENITHPEIAIEDIQSAPISLVLQETKDVSKIEEDIQPKLIVEEIHTRVVTPTAEAASVVKKEEKIKPKDKDKTKTIPDIKEDKAQLSVEVSKKDQEKLRKKKSRGSKKTVKQPKEGDVNVLINTTVASDNVETTSTIEVVQDYPVEGGVRVTVDSYTSNTEDIPEHEFNYEFKIGSDTESSQKSNLGDENLSFISYETENISQQTSLDSSRNVETPPLQPIIHEDNSEQKIDIIVEKSKLDKEEDILPKTEIDEVNADIIESKIVDIEKEVDIKPKREEFTSFNETKDELIESIKDKLSHLDSPPSYKVFLREPNNENKITELNKNLGKLTSGCKREEKEVIIITTVTIISECLETITYKIQNFIKKLNNEDTFQEVKLKQLSELMKELNIFKEAVSTLQTQEASDSELLKTVNVQIEAVEKVLFDSKKQVEIDVQKWEEFLNGINNICTLLHELAEDIENLEKESGISTEEKLNRLNELENINNNYNRQMSTLITLGRSISGPSPRVLPQDLINAARLVSSNGESAAVLRLNLEQSKALAQEYRDTLVELEHVTKIAQAIVESRVVVNSLQHLQDEMQKDRKFFVSLSHCRSILESLEQHLDTETQQRHAELHNRLHNLASDILEKAGERTGRLALAASRWTILEQGLAEETKWLHVALQRAPNLSGVSSGEIEQYLSLYQALSTDIDLHSGRVWKLLDTAHSLQSVICCTGLEENCENLRFKMAQLQDKVNDDLNVLLAFRDVWSSYELNANKLESWLKSVKKDKKLKKQPLDLRRYWELKAEYEVYKLIEAECGRKFEQAVATLPVSDEVPQRHFMSELHNRWSSVEDLLAEVEATMTSSLDPPSGFTTAQRLELFASRLSEMEAALADSQGVIKTDEQLQVYIGRLKVIKSGVTEVQEGLLKLGMVYGTSERTKVTELQGTARHLEMLVTNELQGVMALSDRLTALKKGLARAARDQDRASAVLDQCSACLDMEYGDVRQALVNSKGVVKALSEHWNELMALRQLLHSIPLGVKVSVSPIQCERDISRLQDTHTALEARAAALVSALTARTGLWDEFHNQLDAVRHSVREADYMMELLTVQGPLDYHRLVKATDRLKGVRETLETRETGLEELRTSGRRLEEVVKEEVALKLRAEVQAEEIAFRNTQAELEQLVTKYDKAVSLWSNYNNAKEQVLLNENLTPEEWEQKKLHLEELSRLAAEISDQVGVEVLRPEVDSLSKRLKEAHDALQSIDELQTSLTSKQSNQQNPQVILDTIQKSLKKPSEANPTEQLVLLRDHLIALGKAEPHITSITKEGTDLNKADNLVPDLSVLQLLQLWEKIFRETFQEYHRLSSRLVHTEQSNTVLKLWQDYLTNVNQFLDTEPPQHYHELSEHNQMCQVHQNVLNCQKSLVPSTTSKMDDAVVQQFNLLTNVHNETLARIMEKQAKIQDRIKTWEKYREDQAMLLNWLKDAEADRNKLQLHYISAKSLPKTISLIENLLIRLKEGEQMENSLKITLTEILKFCDDNLRHVITIEHSSISHRISNLQAALLTWKDHLVRVNGGVENYESQISKIKSSMENIKKNETPPELIPHDELKKRISTLQEIARSVEEITSDIKSLEDAKNKLKDSLSPSEIKVMNQQCWIISYQHGDLSHQLAMAILALQERLQLAEMFDKRVEKFLNWAGEVDSRLERMTSQGLPNAGQALRRLETELQAEAALRKREVDWLTSTGEELISVEYPDSERAIQLKNDVATIKEVWGNVVANTDARAAKLRAILQNMSSLDTQLEELRLWLQNIEAKLSAPITIKHATKENIDELLNEHNVVQSEIGKQSTIVADVLNLSELLLNDCKACHISVDNEGIYLAMINLEKRWKMVCINSSERKTAIISLWSRIQQILKRDQEERLWLEAMNKTIIEIENLLDRNCYVDNINQISQEFVNVENEIKKEIDDKLVPLDSMYRHLLREYTLPEEVAGLPEELCEKADSLLKRVSNGSRIAKERASQYERFTKTQAKALTAITKYDALLTMVQVSIDSDEVTSDIESTIQKIENDLNEASTSLSEADSTGLEVMKWACESDVKKVQKMIDEYQNIWTDINNRLGLLKDSRNSSKKVADRSVEVSTIRFETNRSTQVDTLGWSTPIICKDAYLSELYKTCEELEILIMKLETLEQLDTHQKISKCIAQCVSLFELAQHLTENLRTQCTTTESEDILLKVRTLGEKLNTVKQQAQQKQQQLRETSASGKLSCPLCSNKNWQQLDNDLWRLEQWLQCAEGTLASQPSSPPSSIEQLEDAIQDQRELLLDLDSHRSLVVSMNIVGTHLAEHSDSEKRAQELRTRLAKDNEKWDQVCEAAAAWQAKLQLALIQNEEFHATIEEMTEWVEKTEMAVRQYEPIDLKEAPLILQTKYDKLKELAYKLERCEPRIVSLEEAARQVLSHQPEENSSANLCQQRLTTLKLRLQSLSRLITVYVGRLAGGTQTSNRLPTLDTLSQQLLDRSAQGFEEAENGNEVDTNTLVRCHRFFGRVMRASVPISAFLLLLLGAATLLPTTQHDYSCSNNLFYNLVPILRYPNGHPPI